jgi:protein-S-isoprenylcysteine O-methyltransferase Ste14
MSKCRVRLILWFVLVGVSVVGGVVTDVILRTDAFSVVLRALGLVGIVAAHFPLKRTGRLLHLRGEAEQWGCTNRLITDDIYACVRHPHHVGVGVFMTSLGLLIGHRWSFLLIAGTQWLWIFGFLFLVEEPELREKFGEAYERYRERVPMLVPKLGCTIRVLGEPLQTPEELPAERTSG